MTDRTRELLTLATKYAAMPADRRRLFRERFAERGTGAGALPIVPLAGRAERFPLSHAQERLWFLWKLDPENVSYNLPSAVRLRGALDAGAVRRAIERLAVRHEVLRTRFLEQDGVGFQSVDAEPAYEFRERDLSSEVPADTLDAALSEQLRSLSARPFDLERGHLLRVTLLRLGPAEHVLHFVMHHIISDAWSQGVLANEFAACYRAELDGREPELRPLPIQYGDYAAWQREWLEGAALDQQLVYWRERLGAQHPQLELPVTRRRRGVRSSAGGLVHGRLPLELGERLRRVARELQATPFMLLLAAYEAVLGRYSGQRELRVGVPVAGREALETQGLIGFFVNTLVIAERVDSSDAFGELLERTRRRVLEAQAHQDVPFAKLVEALAPERNLGQTPLFQAIFNHVLEARPLALPGLSLGAVGTGADVARFDLALNVSEGGEGFSYSFGYARDILDEPVIARLAADFVALLDAATAAPTRRLGQIALPSRGSARALPAVQAFVSVSRRLRDAARARPEMPAIHCEGERVSHGQLRAWADQIAVRLIQAGVRADERVGLCVERSVALAASLIGVLESGGAFVPLDPTYPEERLAFMLADAGVRCVVADARSAAKLAPILGDRTLIPVDAAAGAAPSAPGREPHPDQLAYVIYTSGSTGNPKGVAISQRALSIHMDDFILAHAISDQDKVLHTSTINFDVALHELLPALIQGGQVEMRGPELWDLETLSAHLSGEGVTFSRIPTAYFQQWLQRPPAPEAVPRLRQITVGGEGLPGDALRRWQSGPLRHIRVANLYGPTETTVACTYRQTQPEDADEAVVPIGVPYPGRAARVMDDAGNVVPPGALGELCIAGETLARGYLDRPSLTASRFVPDPEGPPGSRVYRSGDLSRERADGCLEFLGRMDQQIKLRGFRIELGEIEAVLREVSGVREAAVQLFGSGEGARLVAYFSGDVPLDSLWAALRQKLPGHMVPWSLVPLDALPVMPNGKVDRKALPEPSVEVEAYVAPATEVERRLVAVWERVLALPRIGVSDNFFELGGDSITSLQIVSRAREQGLKLTPRQLFERQTIRELAQVVRDLPVKRRAEQPGQELSGEVPLTPIQRRFFESDVPQRAHYNQSLLLEPSARLDAAALSRALTQCLAHHDVSRLRFVDVDGRWTQRYAERAPAASDVLWRRSARDGGQIEAIGDEAQQSLDLSQGPLLRAVLIDLEDGGQRLLFVVHHLVIDGVSWRVLMEDVQRCYVAQRAGTSAELPPRTTAFSDWAKRLQLRAESAELAAELPYWLDRVGAADSPELPADDPGGGNQNAHAESLSVSLDRQWTEQLLRRAPAAYRTQINDLLLTALARALSSWSGQRSVLIGLEGHGREDLFDDVDLSRTVGWFTTLFPVRLEPELGPAPGALAASIQRVKETLRAVPDKGLGYGVARYMGSERLRRAFAGRPEPRITFNYLGQFDASFDAEALLRPAREHGGAGQASSAPRSNWLTVNGQVYEGELRLSVGYSRAMYRRETIERLVSAYQRELEAVIQHCTSGASGVTPSDFPLAGLSQAELDRLPAAAAQIEDIYPLSPMQQGMFLHALDEPRSAAYVNQLNVRMDHLDPERLASAWAKAIERHEVLRTSFAWPSRGSQPVQIVHRTLPASVRMVRAEAEPFSASALAELARADLARGFDLTQAPAHRLSLVELEGGSYQLLWTHHHVLMDGWSFSRLVREVLELYAGRDRGPASGRFRDYIAWLLQQDRAASERFYKQRLTALEGPTLLAQALPPAPAQPGHGVTHTRLAPELTARLQRFAQAERVTVNTLVQGAWLLVLARYTGQRAVCFGATVSGRPESLPGAEALLGLFINTLPVIQDVPERARVGDWLRAVQAYNLELREHEHTPLYEIQRWAAQGGRALFDTILVFENYPVEEALSGRDAETASGAPTLSVARVENVNLTDYALTLEARLSTSLSIEYSYRRDRFDAAHIDRLRHHTERLLEALARDAGRTLGELEMLSDDERAERLERWNDPPAPALPAPLEAGYVRLFEARACAYPERVAAACAGEVLSYRQLDGCANRIGRALVERAVSPGEPVLVFSERSLELLCAVLGTFKAGGAYVPVDPRQPGQRNAQVIRSSGAKVVLATRALAGVLSDLLAGLSGPERPEPLFIEDVLAQPGSEAPLGVYGHARSLMYVIYTSGSTGMPKGAMVEQAGMLNNQLGKVPYLELGERDVIAQTASQAFDISVWQLLTGLLCGARVEIVSDAIARDPVALLAHVNATGVSILESVPSLIHGMLAEAPVALPSLRVLMPTGEAMPPELARRWLERYPAIPLVNAYGPAECSDDVALQRIAEPPPDGCVHLPIGRPTEHNRLYVLDRELRLVPAGVSAELFVAGVGVGRGYLGDAARTAQSFVPHPYGGPGERLYRTGDRVRQRPDGVLEYIGRDDDQVKIRGHRIELGEIEACLMALPGVREAAVVVRGAEEKKRLVAYVVPERPDDVSRDTLERLLRAALPQYMVPSPLVLLERLPLTPNGKVDKRALPEPPRAEQTSTAPRFPLEEGLCQIWREALGQEPLGVHDDFFELGGHSLLAMQITREVAKLVGTAVPVSLIFEAPSVAKLATALTRLRSEQADRTLVAMEPGPARAPLFCLHYGGGAIARYRTLARGLSSRRPVYGLQSRLYYRTDHVDASIADMVEHYAESIDRAAPAGPVHLLGWSSGALYALDTARALERRGRRLGLVAAVDFLPLLSGQSFDEGIAVERASAARVREARRAELLAWLERSALKAQWRRLLQLCDEDTLDELLELFVRHGVQGRVLDTPAEYLLLDRAQNVLLTRAYEWTTAPVPAQFWWAEQSLASLAPPVPSLRPGLEAQSTTILPGDHASIILDAALISDVAARLDGFDAAEGGA